MHIIKKKMSNHLFFRTKGKWIRLEKDDIIYIQSSGTHCVAVLEDQKVIIQSKISQLSETLGVTDQFMRVHKQFIINLRHLNHITPSAITLGLYRLPVGKMYRESLTHRVLSLE